MRYGQLAADDHGSGRGQPPLVLLHGLTFSRRHWTSVLARLSAADPGRRVIAFDLPGHGESPGRDSYRLAEVAGVLHDAVQQAGLVAPVVAGHSIGAALATVYAGRYPVSGVVNIDQPLRAGGFADFLKRSAPALRGDDYLRVWQALLDGMGAGELPEPARTLVRTVTTPRQDLLLGYWDELIREPAKWLDQARAGDLAAIRAAGVPYSYISGGEVPDAYQSWLTAALPDVAITVMPGAAHFPHLTRPGEVADILTRTARLPAT
jgi:pimeloyl-ACP methyl ester carboxylesterase